MGWPSVVDMNWQGERWTAEQVLALAPDAASQKAGGKLSSPAPWSGTGVRDGALWGLCSGSGSKPYQTVIDLSGPAYRCSCPSRKFPCKHALGLLLLWATGEPMPDAEAPPWAAEWLTGRRERAEREAASYAGAQGADAGEGAAGGGDDGAAARRRADRIEQRERRIAAGATELEQRLTDLVRDGLAGADRSGYAQWDETAARMVDAQAPGLAARVRELGAITTSGAGWPSRLLEECALLHLLSEGFQRVADLPTPLAATARTRVGLTTDTAELLATAEPIRDDWLVLGRQDSDDGKLTTRRVWLRGERTGRMALLLSFGAAGRAPELALPVGLVLDADLAYYPAARPLRAALGRRYGTTNAGGAPTPAVASTPEPAAAVAPARSAGADAASAAHAGATRAAGAPAQAPPGVDVSTALAAYGTALRDDPWLDAWPVVLSRVVPVPDAAALEALADAGAPRGGQRGGGAGAATESATRTGDDGWQLADAGGTFALPIDPRCTSNLWQLTAISGGAPLTVFGECGHRGFVPLTAWNGAPVALTSGTHRTGP